MKEIEQLKAKHVKMDTSVFKDLILSQAGIVDEIRKNQDQRYNEDESKIKELTSQLADLKEILKAETNISEKKNNKLAKCNVYLNESEEEKKKMLQKIKQFEAQQDNLKSKLTKPNLQDQQVLEQGKKKLKLYKEFTGIQWDYQASQHSIEGYVTNKRDYIHHFSYKNQEINEKLTDSLWHEIYLSAGGSSEVTGESSK